MRLKAAEAEKPRTPTCSARLADSVSDRGDWEAAEAADATGQEARSRPLAARWVEARLLELRGELDKAVEAWKWFVDRYNDKRAEIVKNAEALLLVGQASERYYRAKARGEELAESLNDVINEIYEARSGPIPTAGRPPGSKAGCSSRATTNARPPASWPGPSRSTRWRPRCW